MARLLDHSFQWRTLAQCLSVPVMGHNGADNLISHTHRQRPEAEPRARLAKDVVKGVGDLALHVKARRAPYLRQAGTRMSRRPPNRNPKIKSGENPETRCNGRSQPEHDIAG